MLEQDDVETSVVKWKFQRAGGSERHLPALSRALSQIARRFYEWLAQLDARDSAAISRSEKARRSADARADIQNRHVGVEPGQLGQIGGRSKSAGVKLIERCQLLGREPVFLRTQGGERCLQPLG